MLQLLILGPSQIPLETKYHHLAGVTKNLDCLVIRITLEGVAVHLDNSIVYLNFLAQIRRAALAYALDEYARQFLCGTK